MKLILVSAACALLGGCIIRTVPAPAAPPPRAQPQPQPQPRPTTTVYVDAPAVASCSWEAVFEARYGQPFRVADVALVSRGGGIVRGLDRVVGFAYNDITTRPAIDDGADPAWHVVEVRLLGARDGATLATRDAPFLDAIGKALREGADLEQVVLRQLAEPEPTPDDVRAWLDALYDRAEEQLRPDELDSFRVARAGVMKHMASVAYVSRKDRAMTSTNPLGDVSWHADFDMAAGFDPLLSFAATYPMSNGDYEAPPPREQHRRVSLPLVPSCQ